jgi:hypothetical protein
VEGSGRGLQKLKLTLIKTWDQMCGQQVNHNRDLLVLATICFFGAKAVGECFDLQTSMPEIETFGFVAD